MFGTVLGVGEIISFCIDGPIVQMLIRLEMYVDPCFLNLAGVASSGRRCKDFGRDVPSRWKGDYLKSTYLMCWSQQFYKSASMFYFTNAIYLWAIDLLNLILKVWHFKWLI